MIMSSIHGSIEALWGGDRDAYSTGDYNLPRVILKPFLDL